MATTLRRAVLSVRDLSHALRHAHRLTADGSSFARLGADLVLSKLMRVVPWKPAQAERSVRFRDGVTVHYRLNRGDLQSIREVWMDEAYRLPFPLKPDVVVDLGANIGLTSLWLAKRYGCRKILALEPWHANASLAARNFESNGVRGTLVEAAVGPKDGQASFGAVDDSNKGNLSASGTTQVRLMSMKSVLKALGETTGIDLVKMDIEGGEQDLLMGDLSWLRSVKALIVEFHPDRIDYPGLIRRIEEQGFRYYRSESVFPGSMDAFLRNDLVEA